MSLITFSCGLVCLFIYLYIYIYFLLLGDCHKIGKVMFDVEVVRSKTRLLLESKKQNSFASENNLKSTRVP